MISSRRAVGATVLLFATFLAILSIGQSGWPFVWVAALLAAMGVAAWSGSRVVHLVAYALVLVTSSGMLVMGLLRGFGDLTVVAWW